MNDGLPVLWYVADPMCSWCWGFAPVIEAIKQAYADRLKPALLLGGLRPYTRDPLPEAQRREILHHWQQVHARSGQPFAFDGALPAGFVYDTEPASRAVVTVAELRPEQTFAMFKAIQHAFYAEQQDVTTPTVLSRLASTLGLAEGVFRPLFESPAMAERTRAHFHKARAWGVQGFPTLILQKGDRYFLLASGWRPFDELQPEIDATLSAT
jgi:putative protein-disulfide isomerase